MEGTFDILNTTIKENYYMACIWPTAEPTKTDEAEIILNQVGKVIYAQEVMLTYLGMKNFMTQIYGHQAWTGTMHNRFRGVMSKADVCYKAGRPTKTYVFEAQSLDEVIDLKERIRQIYGIDKHSIHISDNAKETYDMIQLLYNKNSVDFLNYANPYRYRTVYTHIKRLKKLLQEKNLEKKRFILGMDAMIEVCGLRKAKFLDGITDYPSNSLVEADININMKHSAQAYGMTLSELLYDAKNFFYFEEMKFMTPQCVLEAKPTALNEKTKHMLERFVKQTQSGAKPYPEYRIKLRKIRANCISKAKKLI